MPGYDLPLLHALDPRPHPAAQAAPLRAAVHIPLDELPARVHELPPRGAQLTVVGPRDPAAAALDWLQKHGRCATYGGSGIPGNPHTGLVQGRLWSPSASLEALLPQLRPGIALDLGCGTGRDAVFLSAAGWRVLGIDRLPDALARAADLARQYAPPDAEICWLCRDLRESAWSPPEAADLVLMSRYFDPAVAERARSWLKPGGHMLIDLLTSTRQGVGRRPRLDLRQAIAQLEGCFSSHDRATTSVRECGGAQLVTIHAQLDSRPASNLPSSQPDLPRPD
jgi:tellurite methyltransferase